MASFAALLKFELAADQAIDSRNNMAALLGEDAVGLPFMIEEAGTLAVRRGDWKYVAARGPKGVEQLYNLSTDIGERHDLAAEHPERVTQLKQLLDQLQTAKNGARGHG